MKQNEILINLILIQCFYLMKMRTNKTTNKLYLIINTISSKNKR